MPINTSAIRLLTASRTECMYAANITRPLPLPLSRKIVPANFSPAQPIRFPLAPRAAYQSVRSIPRDPAAQIAKYCLSSPLPQPPTLQPLAPRHSRAPRTPNIHPFRSEEHTSELQSLRHLV